MQRSEQTHIHTNGTVSPFFVYNRNVFFVKIKITRINKSIDKQQIKNKEKNYDPLNGTVKAAVKKRAGILLKLKNMF